MELGVLTLLPPLIVIAVAVKTKCTTSSLLVGALLCCVLQSGWGFLPAFVDLLYSVGTSRDTVWYVVFVALFGCILGIWSATGATKSVIDRLAVYATNQRRTLVLTWLIGVLVCIDDFTSIAVRGTMTRLYDKNKIPRAMLAYIAAATASPLCSLVPVGTWAIFYQSSFSAYDSVSSMGSGLSVYTAMVPFMFYGWFSLIISLLVSVGLIPPLGGMKKVYQRAERTGELYAPESRRFNLDAAETQETDTGHRASGMACFFAPLILFVATVVASGDVITGCMAALAVLVALSLILGKGTWRELMGACMDGAKSMVSLVVVVFAAYLLRDSLIQIGLPDFVMSVAEPFMSPVFLPAITFVICAVLTFASGSNWGATLAVAAIVIPLCDAIDANMILVLAAVVDGAAFGAHACFYCDVTIFTSGMTKIDNIEHATTQLSYCLIGAAATTFALVACGMLFA